MTRIIYQNLKFRSQPQFPREKSLNFVRSYQNPNTFPLPKDTHAFHFPGKDRLASSVDLNPIRPLNASVSSSISRIHYLKRLRVKKR